MNQNPDLLSGKSVLHFAPEVSLAKYLSTRCASHTGADIASRPQCFTLNIEALDLEEGSFDTIICNHVLEHVDDRKALSEMFRVLKPGGHALLMTPIIEGWSQTFEDNAVVCPADREVKFGQSDHVRMYGRDLRDRIQSAGFGLSEFTAVEPEVTQFGLLRGEKVFVASKG